MILFEGGGAAGKAVGTVNGARDRIAGQWTKGEMWGELAQIGKKEQFRAVALRHEILIYRRYVCSDSRCPWRFGVLDLWGHSGQQAGEESRSAVGCATAQ